MYAKRFDLFPVEGEKAARAISVGNTGIANRQVARGM